MIIAAMIAPVRDDNDLDQLLEKAIQKLDSYT